MTEGGREGEDKSVDLALGAVRELMNMFRAERYIYLGAAGIGMALLAYAAFLMIYEGTFDLGKAGLLFGSSGLFAVSGARILFLLNRTYNLTEDLLRHRFGLDPRHVR
jgi:hypothetical protein